MIRGFFLGKFMPPHKGHLFVCDVAKNFVDELTVFVCSHDAEPINGFLRAQWMRQCLVDPKFKVSHMHRDIPQEPKEHPEFWTIWRDAIFEHHPKKIDWVFGSEDYIFQLADTLNARPFLVDQSRKQIPISATRIRSNPKKHWSFIPKAVKPYYQKKYTLIGAESTGKSTIATELANEFETLAIHEYGRDYDANFRNGKDWQEQDFVTLAKGHIALALAISPRTTALVFEDTNILQTVVWAEALIGYVPKQLLELFKNSLHPSLYILLNAEVPWTDDGTRYHQDQRQRIWFQDRLRYWLGECGANWVEVSGQNWADRRDQVKRIVDEQIQTPKALS